MSDFSLDIKYLGSISSHLPLFKWQRYGEVARCRCILCGDSKRDKTKTRGFFYPNEHRTGLQYKCHNCGEPMSFWFFLKKEFPGEYREYRLEQYRGKGGRTERFVDPDPDPIEEVTQEPDSVQTKLKHDWTYVSDLFPEHPARTYCLGRGLSEAHLKRIVYTSNFNDWAAKNIGECLIPPPRDERLVFPFFDEGGRCYGAQGRVFYPCDANSRFKTAMLKDTKLGKVFGLERLNKDSPVIVVEGVIDSLFLPNCVAICGGDINDFFKSLSEKVYVVLDNEPRSRDTIKRMEKAISDGFTVVIWGIDTRFKDINDMIAKGGMSVRDIIKHIANNSLSGTRARTKLAFWKKI